MTVQRHETLIDPAGLATWLGSMTARGISSRVTTTGLGLVSQTNAAGQTAYYDFDAIGSTVGLSTASGDLCNSLLVRLHSATLRRHAGIGQQSFPVRRRARRDRPSNGMDSQHASEFYDPRLRTVHFSDDPLRSFALRLNYSYVFGIIRLRSS